MKDTIIIEIDKDHIDEEKIIKCAKILNDGGTVAFPTETVYGLGGNALDPKAIRKIFEAKGRPSDNPLIVHIASMDEILPLVKQVPNRARQVMDSFWPGPLTLIFEKSDIIPDEISAGLPTVAIRMPSHPIALELIKQAGVPIAAPSANISGRPSPTKAEHVIEDLLGRVDAIVSGGSSDIGVESTVLDLTGDIPTILRPGGVTKEMLEKILGEVYVDPAIEGNSDMESTPKSPGMKYTHYAPKAKVVIIEGHINKIANKINEMKIEYEKEGKKVGVICTEESMDKYGKTIVKSMGNRKSPETIAANLFKVLREFDETDVDIILSESIEAVDIGRAVMNRLNKAAGYCIVKVD